MQKRYINECIKNYALSSPVRLHMPGHKGKCSLYSKENSLYERAFSCDITELSFSDNLAKPEGCIKQAEEDIAKILGCKKSFILTGGSSLGVLSMVYAVKNRGKKMIVARSSHKSVFNALKLCNIEPIFLNEDLSSGLPSPNYLNKNIIENCDNDVIGALITSPDYFGNSADLKYFSENLKRQKKLLLIDGAHGGHFKFTNEELYPGNYADLWVDGAHKTLETLTQGAILNLNNSEFIDEVRDALNIFSTSSPSYLIMASVENGVKSFNEIDKNQFKVFEENRKLIENAVLKRGFLVYKSPDRLKLTIDFNNKADGMEVSSHFEEKGIFVELVSSTHMLMMFSPYLEREEAERICNAILSCPLNNVNKNKISCHLPKRKISYKKAVESDFELVDLKDSLNRICAFNAGVFPPCYPVITAGEVFDNSVIEALSVENTFGITNGKVKVLKEN